MRILAHRGYWTHTSEKNSLEAFNRALDLGFGIETDIRDCGGVLVVSHDMPTIDSLKFSDFIKVVKSKKSPGTLALNIKSDGLQDLLIGELCGVSDYFCFDMSIPDSLGYMKKGYSFYSRKSDIEEPSLFDKCTGVWLDNFSTNELNLDALLEYLKAGKSVALVSPELHNLSYESYWSSLSGFLSNYPTYDRKILLCTDFPVLAKEYFDVK